MRWSPVGGRVSSPQEVCEGPYRMCLRSAPQTEEGTLLPMASHCSLWAQRVVQGSPRVARALEWPVGDAGRCPGSSLLLQQKPGSEVPGPPVGFLESTCQQQSPDPGKPHVKGWWPAKSRAGRPKMCTGQLCPPFRDPDSKEQTKITSQTGTA